MRDGVASECRRIMCGAVVLSELMGLAHKAPDGGTQEVILCSSVTTFWNYFKI